MASPSNYRRQGRKDFIPDCDPAESYSGKVGSSNYDSYVEGWEIASKEYDSEQKEKEEAEENRDYRFKQLKEEIIHLAADPALHSILLDMLELLEEKTDGTATN